MDEALRDAFDEEPQVEAVWRYGSTAKGHDDETSDVDLGVLFRRPPEDPLSTVELAERLADATGVEPARLDVRSLNDAPPRFLHQVLAYGTLIYEREPAARIRFETEALARYYDVRHLLEVQDRAQRERFRRGEV